MKGVLVSEEGAVTPIDCSDTFEVGKHLGEQPIELFSAAMNCALKLHEMARVFEMPANVVMSELSQEVLFGPVLVCPTPDSRYYKHLYSREFARDVRSKNSDGTLKRNLTEYFRSHGGGQRFSLEGSDRWSYNGEAFESIVITQADDHMQDGIERFAVWLSTERQTKKAMVRVCEFSLREVMEMLILADEETSAGTPPPEFQSVAQKLGLWAPSRRS